MAGKDIYYVPHGSKWPLVGSLALFTTFIGGGMLLNSAPGATWQAVQETPRVRADSKQAQVIALLQRPQGTSIAEIMALTGWQAHSIRGLFAGTLKKRGIAVTSEKAEGGERVYRAALPSEATA